MLENKTSSNPIIIYIIDSQISKKNKKLLTNTVNHFGAEVSYLTIDPTLYDNFILTHHLTQETYHRISIPDLLGEDIEKVIYLDSDMIIKEDVTKLWENNIDDYFIAAVMDAWLGLKKLRHTELSIPDECEYFNAGVLVINLKKWREHSITKQIIDFMNKNQSIIRYPSQDSMNAVLYDKWLQLEPKWNYQSKHLYNTDLRLEPSIIHYTGTDSKPWWSEKHPLRAEYDIYSKKWKKNIKTKKKN
ncbi:glycosyltransferase family 8 protein [Bacillus haimaensis]|uniref:glycosyltransferase family 8 protein n=1 Tax=Bacillus haimaensis TaxID=3160967 RepID=UPI003AA951C0